MQTLEYEEGVGVSPGIVESFHSVALNWWRGASLRALLGHIELAEGDLLVTLNQTIDLLQQLQGAVGQALDARGLWQTRGSGRRLSRSQHDMRLRLEDLRGLLAEAWRHMLRGSVALSRAIPTLTTPVEGEEGEEGEEGAGDTGLPPIPPLPMAEDEDAEEAREDRVEGDAGDEDE